MPIPITIWPAALAALSALFVPVVTFLLQQSYRNESQKSQAQAENRSKRLEAVEKTLSILKTAKDDHNIILPTENIRRELVHLTKDYLDPRTLALEALSKWNKKSFLRKLGSAPNFAVPVTEANKARRTNRLSVIYLTGFYLVLLLYVFIQDGTAFPTTGRSYITRSIEDVFGLRNDGHVVLILTVTLAAYIIIAFWFRIETRRHVSKALRKLLNDDRPSQILRCHDFGDGSDVIDISLRDEGGRIEHVHERPT